MIKSFISSLIHQVFQNNQRLLGPQIEIILLSKIIINNIWVYWYIFCALVLYIRWMCEELSTKAIQTVPLTAQNTDTSRQPFDLFNDSKIFSTYSSTHTLPTLSTHSSSPLPRLLCSLALLIYLESHTIFFN